MNILIASNNKHKVKEIKEIVYKNVGNTINFITAKELNININPEETGSTLAENAKIKAIAFYNASKIPVIADDSGLEVEILNGLPGIHSARFADINNDKANREKLLSLLKNETNRKAKFHTFIAYYNGQETLFFEGECKGNIIHNERGNNGFGYDPIFVPDGYNKTFAELTENEKNKISHRHNAILNFCNNFLKNLK